MDTCQLAACLLAVFVLFVKLVERKYGANRNAPLAFLEDMRHAIHSFSVSDFGKYYKEKIKELSSAAFTRMKMRGVLRVDKPPHIVSKGYMKLDYILRATKVAVSGHVLSLCCGRGGWEQRIAGMPAVTRITSITFGSTASTPGHEDFRREFYPGWAKVRLINADVREVENFSHDFLLFDGGESRPDGVVEAKKFNDLLYNGVVRQLTRHTKGFIIKILTPWDPRTQEIMKEIQTRTKKGDLVRVPTSRNSTLELYLVSGQPTNLLKKTQILLSNVFERAVVDNKINYYKILDESGSRRDPVRPKTIEILKQPDYSECLKELELIGRKEYGNTYKYWDSLGVYDIGVKGSNASHKNFFTSYVIGELSADVENYNDWGLTDTTPEGFMKVFRTKVDTAPVENHPFESEQVEVYRGLAHYFKKRGFVLKELTWEELEQQANKQGAAGYADKEAKNIGEFFKLTDWRKRVEKCRRHLLSGKPIQAVFNTMGKREKKKIGQGKSKGSRMVAYQSIAMRLLETKLFGNLLKLTKNKIDKTETTMNRFGVGGLGLHDFGSRIEEIWLGTGVADDVAGFDTRIGVFDHACEYEFCRVLGANPSHKAMYAVYSHPMILIPIPSPKGTVRSELLLGRGQRMSGTAVTYSMNTLTRIAKFLLTVVIDRKIHPREVGKFVMEIMEDTNGKKTDIAGVVSGDDAMFTTHARIDELQRCGTHLDMIGMQRKDIHQGQFSPVLEMIEDVEFCSHHYERITYYDSHNAKKIHRYMPTRDVSEILAKISFKVGMYGVERGEQAWAAAQALNLLVNYHHLRTIRAVGIALRCLIDQNLVPDEVGGVLRPTPWMTRGDILDITNRVLFGESTAYPVQGFAVRTFGHLGYISKTRETSYDLRCYGIQRKLWRRRLCDRVCTGVSNFKTGGDTTWIEEWSAARVSTYDDEGYRIRRRTSYY